jgi:hypothetical protein
VDSGVRWSGVGRSSGEDFGARYSAGNFGASDLGHALAKAPLLEAFE